jgi:dTDP-4-amino-4,6-dideoxygalactose transaminase
MMPLESPFPSWPHFSQIEADAVRSVLLSNRVNYWTGDEGRQFEAEYAHFLGVRHAIALMNGTTALELPLRMWGVGSGDDVIVTPRSFMASTSCVVTQGARPIFADVDRDSGNITAASIERVFTPKTKAIVLVHLAGWPCEMDPIIDFAAANGIKVIEDCAQAHGATYRGQEVGSLGHAGAFSFCQDKIITTGGEGGLLATNDEEMWGRAWSFKDHGKSYDAVFNQAHAPGFRWLCESFGTNWRMTELQATLGRIQLRALPDWKAQRRRNATVLTEALGSIPGLRTPLPASHIEHAFYRLYAYVEAGALREGWSRDRVIAAIAANGIPCFHGSCSEIYMERAFENTAFRPARSLPIAKELGDTSMAFLLHPTLTEAHMHRAADVIKAVMMEAIR